MWSARGHTARMTNACYPAAQSVLLSFLWKAPQGQCPVQSPMCTHTDAWSPVPSNISFTSPYIILSLFETFEWLFFYTERQETSLVSVRLESVPFPQTSAYESFLKSSPSPAERSGRCFFSFASWDSTCPFLGWQQLRATFHMEHYETHSRTVNLWL